MGFASQSFSSLPVPPAFAGDNCSGDAGGNVVNLLGNRDMDKAPDPITAKAREISASATADERAMAETIYGEAGGKPYEDKTAIGWTMRARKDKYPDLSYHDIATHPRWYVPRDSLRKANDAELQAWKDSFRAARYVLSANPNANPILGVTHFYDPSIEAPDWTKGATQVQYGSGGLLFYKGVKWSK